MLRMLRIHSSTPALFYTTLWFSWFIQLLIHNFKTVTLYCQTVVSVPVCVVTASHCWASRTGWAETTAYLPLHLSSVGGAGVAEWRHQGRLNIMWLDPHASTSLAEKCSCDSRKLIWTLNPDTHSDCSWCVTQIDYLSVLWGQCCLYPG